MNMLQSWIIVAIGIAALNWKLAVKFWDNQFWPRLGWQEGEFGCSDVKNVRNISGLIRWAMTAVTFFGILSLVQPSNYNFLAFCLLMLSVANLCQYCALPLVKNWLANPGYSYGENTKHRGMQRVLGTCYFVSSALFVIGTFFWQFIPATISENAYIKAQTISVSQMDNLSTKLVAVKQVNEIMRNGTTWFEIQAHWEPGLVYQVQEHPDYNSALKELASNNYNNPSRYKLIEIKWSSANVAQNATTRNDLVVSNESPKVVLVTHLVCQ